MKEKYKPPAHLSEASKEIFSQYVPRVFQAPLQTNELTLYLEDLDAREKIRAKIQEKGLLTQTAAGTPKLNPLVRELRKMNSQLISRSKFLGLNRAFYFAPVKSGLSVEDFM